MDATFEGKCAIVGKHSKWQELDYEIARPILGRNCQHWTQTDRGKQKVGYGVDE